MVELVCVRFVINGAKTNLVVFWMYFVVFRTSPVMFKTKPFIFMNNALTNRRIDKYT